MIRIITDSSSDLTKKYCEKNNIAMIPLALNFGSASYYDGIDISKEEFYHKLADCSELPTTSLAGPQRFIEEYNKYPEDDIICLMIASGLSGTMQAALIAKEEVKRDNITVIDTGQTTAGLSLIIEVAIQLINSGKSYTEVIESLKKDIPRVEIRAVVDTLKYLVKGGRLSKVSGAVGGVLSIKPIITCVDGELANVGKARGFKAAAKLVATTVNESIDNTMPIKFLYSYNDENLEILKSELEYIKGETIALGAIVGTHIGPNAAGIAYFRK
ncbi:MAG: DegV family protein [Erysipelotrichaceae bacterium]